MSRRIVAFALLAIALLATTTGPGQAQTATTAAQPRTVSDITAILDQQKPSPGAASKMRAEADQPAPMGAGAAVLARFYYKRGVVRSDLGRHVDALADADSALAAGRGHLPPGEISLMRQLQAQQYFFMGDPKRALETFLTRAREAIQTGNKGPLFNTYRHISGNLIHTGDLNQAETYVRRVQALLSEARSWSSFPLYGSNWQAELYEATGQLAEAKGQFAEAEAAYRRAELAKRETLLASAKWPVAPPRSQLEFNIDSMISAQGRVKARQGKLAEAEADVRQALLNRLTAAGKYTSGTAQQATALADVLAEQGRYPEAEKLARTALDIYRTIGLAEDTQTIVHTLSQIATILNLQGHPRQAAQIDNEIDAATKTWDPKRREPFSINVGRISTLYRTGRVEAGMAAAQTLVERNASRFGADSFNSAYARGTLAMGLSLAGRAAEAVREFKFAIPILLSGSSDTDDDSATGVILRKRQIQTIVERYMELLVRTNVATGVDSAAETFRLAEAIRSRSVQQALSASGARVAANDPAVADLVRKEQDSQKQFGAQVGLLNNLLALPPEQRDDPAINGLRKQIETLQTDGAKAKQEIRRRFPKYADLIDPKPPAIDEIKSTLKPDEALVSFYFGSPSSFVWALPKEGPVVFATISASSGDIDAKIKRLREALEPNVSTISAIPPFDLALAHELYDLLLKPVQSGWRPAKSLIVVTNGALGMLPLGLLTTESSPIGATAPLFAAYRDAPWLARTHAVTMIPSTSSLLTLRRLPPGSPRRNKLIGFGDPYFNEQQAADAEQQAAAETLQLASTPAAATRGVPFRTRAVARTADVDRTEFALLPRLPDTRLELIAMAHALDADPAKALFLGRDANERNVETIDLSRFRIVAFATHGLVPGDLDGLTQPALALTAPQIAGVEGDGLLTMEKILPLKLDADWVVLSACNTAAGAAAGAEAASGLGRAFFYAGTRALLVTNWSVHSASARELITDLFRRQSADPQLARAEALRLAMMSMIDGPGFVDSSGTTLFAYAHPLFWAPYSVIGDGGGT
jgi:CHAT domain-containing protein